MAAVRERKRSVVNSFSGSSERGMQRHETLELVKGEARFEGPLRVAVDLPDGVTRRFEARYVFINAGARPKVPQVSGLSHVPYLDNASVMELEEVPTHLLVLGGGFVGLEFAQMFRRFGAQVTLIEQGPRIAKREDDDITSALARILADEGVRVRTGARVEALRRDGERVVATVSSDGKGEMVSASHLLVAIGRTPNTDALELPSAGIETDERGYIRVNDRLETNVPGVYALGDVNGGPPFTHVSYDDFRVVRANLLGEGPERSRQERLIPYTLYTDPQLGRVGLTEREARERGYEVKVARLSMSRVARAIETGETAGIMKAVVDARSERILGAAVLGLEGGETLALIQTAMMGGLPYTALRDAIYAHPTLAESVNNLFMKLE
jgi:pyruvate/2-oxoglutarate dehydrogenase complex dihydrolipoamide dehydrogenase (E3) component